MTVTDTEFYNEVCLKTKHFLGDLVADFADCGGPTEVLNRVSKTVMQILVDEFPELKVCFRKGSKKHE